MLPQEMRNVLKPMKNHYSIFAFLFSLENGRFHTQNSENIDQNIWSKMAEFIFVPKGAQCSEIYEIIIFQFLFFEKRSVLFSIFLEN